MKSYRKLYTYFQHLVNLFENFHFQNSFQFLFIKVKRFHFLDAIKDFFPYCFIFFTHTIVKINTNVSCSTHPYIHTYDSNKHFKVIVMVDVVDVITVISLKVSKIYMCV